MGLELVPVEMTETAQAGRLNQSKSKCVDAGVFCPSESSEGHAGFRWQPAVLRAASEDRVQVSRENRSVQQPNRSKQVITASLSFSEILRGIERQVAFTLYDADEGDGTWIEHLNK